MAANDPPPPAERQHARGSCKLRRPDNTSDDIDTAPDGGLEAWLVAADSFCIFFCCLGFSNSFGVLADYYLTRRLRGEPATKIAWIGSLSAFLQFFSGMVGGPLFDQYGAKAS